MARADSLDRAARAVADTEGTTVKKLGRLIAVNALPLAFCVAVFMVATAVGPGFPHPAVRYASVGVTVALICVDLVWTRRHPTPTAAQ